MNSNKVKPTSPGRRSLILSDFSELTNNKPQKKLLYGLKNSSGRNNSGRITVRHKGSGHKRKYRLIDFKRNKFDVTGRVTSIEYDPNRTAFIALITYLDGEKKYILQPKTLKVDDCVISSRNKVDIKIGNSTYLSNIPQGTVLHNIELKEGKGGQLCRSAGNSATLVGFEDKFAIVKLKSGQTKQIPGNCFATIGEVGNASHSLIKLGKAGRRRWLNVRPTVRGTAMNPVDHPHGGGEGKSKGKHPVTPWGKPTKGAKTRKKKR